MIYSGAAGLADRETGTANTLDTKVRMGSMNKMFTATAVTENRLLDASYTALLTSGKVATPRGDRYANGFIENVEGGVRSVGHGGGAPGMNGDLRVYPDSGHVVAARANTGSGASELVAWVSGRLPVQATQVGNRRAAGRRPARRPTGCYFAYLMPQPYGRDVAVVTALPAMPSVSAAVT